MTAREEVYSERTARAISLSSMDFNASPTASPTFTPAFLSSSAAARRRGFSLMLDVNYISKVSHGQFSTPTTRISTYPRTLVRLPGAFHGLRILKLLHITLELLNIVLQLSVLPQFLLQYFHEGLEGRLRCLVVLSARRRVE